LESGRSDFGGLSRNGDGTWISGFSGNQMKSIIVYIHVDIKIY